jgi:hypothetical protein
MPQMNVGGNTTFTQVYQRFKPGLLDNSSQHLRLEGNNLHTHNQLVPHDKGAAALQHRTDKYTQAAGAVKQSIANQYSQSLADRVFQNLNLPGEVRLADLRPIKQEVNRLTAELQRAVQGLQSIPRPTFQGVVVPPPNSPAKLASAIYHDVSAYIGQCNTQGIPPDKQVLADLLNHSLADYVDAHPGASSLDALPLHDRAMLMSMVETFDLGPQVRPQTTFVQAEVDRVMQDFEQPLAGYDRTALFLLAKYSPNCELSSRFDFRDPTSQFSSMKDAFFEAVTNDNTIMDALRREKAGAKLSPTEKHDCIQRALAHEATAFGQPSAPLVVRDGMSSIGNYDFGTKELYISRRAFDRNKLSEILNIASHENLHNFQDQFMEQAKSAPGGMHPDDLAQATIFTVELANYINSRVDQIPYKNQSMEQPAMHIGKALRGELDKLV